MVTTSYPGVYIQEIPSGVRTLVGVATSITAFVGTAPVSDAELTNTPVQVNSFGEYERIFGGLDASSPMSYAVRDYYVNGGSTAIIVSVAESGQLSGSEAGATEYIGSQASKTGIYALEDADLFNLLCILPDSTDNGDGSYTFNAVDASVYAAAATYCEARRAMVLVDPPATWTSSATAAANVGTDITIGTAQKKNAALYFPRLRQPDPLDSNQVKTYAPSGAVAGVIATTDANRGVWKAPAGIEAGLSGVPALSVPLTDAENGTLNPLAINCLRTKPPAGRIVWGARTLAGTDAAASEWKYMPVRRLALYIEESLFRGTQWAVFEPNDAPLWAELRLNVGSFMQDLFRKGAFQGTSPREAYFVKCDAEVNPQSDIDKGIVNVIVGFAPLKPAEFVIIQLQQIAGQA